MSNSILYGQSEQHLSWLSDKLAIHQAVVTPWQQLCQQAKRDGIELEIASGFRSFERQLSIWNGKFNGELTVKDINNQVVNIEQLPDSERINEILTFSALPGTSRHHWGTDIDIYSPSLLTNGKTLQLEPWEYQAGGPFATLSDWLQQHAADYGFYFPYDKYRGGVAPEPWHLSYFPLAQQFQQQFNSKDLTHYLQSNDIMGKDVIIKQLDTILTQYVFNIGQIPNE
ncbi:carboxypeptidase [Thalassotalea insulae]|uniref:Carboxypeptidase n=1 Tax=Thalassotalea insulae TaxID=2056778 RepID=A0ABQ6GLT1_9GAMM|nr:M15 family metallopeptidase [Thalassotalea insulae]GLX76887.1 carboxypeptidase [Thalassotalea insulae]